MQRESNVKVKEAITLLCRLLSALDVEAVPTAEAFRRAKFNKTEAAQDLWRLLSSILKKTFEADCACAKLTVPSHFDAELRFVKSALWHIGYGGWWVVGPQACCSREEIGSRDLLLALGWMLASGNLLADLMREKILQLEVLSSSVKGMCRGLELDLIRRGEDTVAVQGDLRSLQWQYGKMRLLWRSLLAAQQEQAKLTHEVFFNTSGSAAPPMSDTSPDDAKVTGLTALDKDLACIRSLNGILKLYLEWNTLEPLFWCWMDPLQDHHRSGTIWVVDHSQHCIDTDVVEDSVLDLYLSDRCREGFAELPVREQAATWSCSHSDKARRSIQRLEKMMLKMQTELQHKRAEQATRVRTSQDRGTGVTGLSNEQKAEIERRVADRLQSLSLADTSTEQDYTPYFQEQQHSGSALKSKQQAETSGMLHASTQIKKLRQRKAMLEQELERVRRSQRDEIESRVSTLGGLVLVTPR